MLLRQRAESIKVFTSPQRKSQDFIITIRAVFESREAKGTGISSNETNAFIKALVELGESLIVQSHGLKDRSGIAGGFLHRSAAIRAKSELIERDAFLYHYRSGIPFAELQSIQESKTERTSTLCYRMLTAEAGWHATVAFDAKTISGERSCMLMGMGCGVTAAIAQRKAVGELEIMMADHLRRPDWCSMPARADEKLPDFHHKHSRDLRNRLRIRELCRHKTSFRIQKAQPWEIRKFKSPVCLVKYLRADSRFLSKLTFGAPEPDIDSAQPPLYHPIW